MIRPGEVICTERPHRGELYMRISVGALCQVVRKNEFR